MMFLFYAVYKRKSMKFWNRAGDPVYWKFFPDCLCHVSFRRSVEVAVKLAKSSTNVNKSSSGDDIPERDVTYRLICSLIYH